MTQLATLQRGLLRVRRYRSTARWGSALAGFLTVLLAVLLAAFLIDVATHMGRLERAIVLVLCIVAAVWALRRYLLPALRTREEPVGLALMVERQQGIGSDLVAALQFADAGRPQYGSSQLRTAVIDYTDQVSGSLDYLEGFSREDLWRRLWLLALVMALVLIPVVAYGDHVRVFLNRFMLGNAHYPTRTIIADVVSPGDRAVYGQPVVFKVRVGGERPQQGRAQLRALTTGLKTNVALAPDPEDPGLFVGQLARALDDLSYTLHLGDAYTEPVTLQLVPLPVVHVDVEIETPAYAADKFQTGDATARRRVALEGSRVTPVVTSDKPLQSATLTVNEQTYPLEKDGDRFTLTAADTPMANVQATLRYEVQVIDRDGLSLERPISGTLQVRSDRPPRIAVATLTQYVLPSATPEITLRAIDDFALDRIVVRKQLQRAPAAADVEETSAVVATLEDHPGEWEKAVRVSLADLDLQKGDRVALIFEAFDHRGALPGKSTESDRLLFQVTDRAGILAGLRQLDTQMDKKLDQIIRAQLGIGD